MSDLNLTKHGTTAFQLSPSSILATAQADLTRRIANIAANKTGGGMQRYAFHRKYVCAAATALDLVQKALDDRLRGQESNKRETVILYRDEAALRAAVQAASAA